MDRNQKAKDDFAAARARKQFQDAYAAGQAGAVDRFGRKLQDGDLVQFIGAQPIIFEVVKLGPSLDPSHPAGVVRFELTATIPFALQANQPISGITKVFDVSQRAGLGAMTPEGDEPPAVTAATAPNDNEEHSGRESEQPAGPVDAPALSSDEP